MNISERKHSFNGSWITAPEYKDVKPVDVFHRQLEEKEINTVIPGNRHILFRKRFRAESGKRTVIYISADDYYRLYINGRFVCRRPAPG